MITKEELIECKEGDILTLKGFEVNKVEFIYVNRTSNDFPVIVREHNGSISAYNLAGIRCVGHPKIELTLDQFDAACKKSKESPLIGVNVDRLREILFGGITYDWTSL